LNSPATIEEEYSTLAIIVIYRKWDAPSPAQ